MLPARICLSLFPSSLFSKNSKKGKNYLLLLLIFSFWSNQAKAQNITPAPDGTGTVVTPEGSRIDITGGTFSRDGKNLFHSFSQFGVQTKQIANFLSNPSIRNILGRVTGGDRSIINGLIQVSGGNSNLYLVNPAGIIFGTNAQLNVPASFTATTATGIGFGNNNWLNATGASNYSELVGTPSDFAFNASVPGSIVNVGNLTVSSGQNLALVGGNVISTGTLTAPGGNITIAAVPGSSNVKISQPGHLLSLEIDPSALGSSGINSASLPQLLTGDGGSAATGVTVDSSNQLVLTASGTRVPIDGGTHTQLAIASGSLNVSGATGGTVQVLGDKVGLIGANINASGTAGGGTVLIGGDYQGKGSAINASSTFVSSDSAIDASASQNGNAGRVIVWANETTRFLGNISARGGENSGNGGFVEVSGKNNLEFAGSVDTTATTGEKGTLLLDPKNILIRAGGTDPVAGQLFTLIPDGTATISGANLSAAIDLNDVTLQANNDITINDNVTATTPGNGLTLQAGRSIAVNANRVINLSGDFIAKINDENANPAERNPGLAQFVMNDQSQILTNGGNVTISPGTLGGSAIGSVSILGATINSGSGNISITGTAGAGEINNLGIFLDNGGVVESAGTGNITMNGTGGAGTNGNHGIWLDAGSRVSSVNGNISLTGTGNGTGERNLGIYIFDNSVVRSTGRGNIILRGTGSSTAINNRNDGIEIIDGVLVEATGTGSITLIGTGGAGRDANDGVSIVNAIVSSVDGDITLTGTANGSGNNNRAVSLFNNAVVRSTGKGNVTLTGNNNSVGIQDNKGVELSNYSRVESTGTGNISLTGTAANGLEGIGMDTESFINQTGTGSRITLTSDEIQFDNTSQIRGKGIVQLQPLTPTLGITVGDVTADARLNLDTAKLNRLQNGFSQIIIGRDNGRGAIAINSHSFSDPVKIQSPVGNSTITSTGAIAGTGDASITLLAKNVNVNGTIASPAGITLTADEINLRGGANSVSSNNAIALQPLTPSLNITIGGIGNDASLNLNNIDLAALKDGSNINIGLAAGTGTITVDSTATFNGSVNVVGGFNLVAANRSNTWNITGTNAGNLNYPNGFSFANIENLTGGNLDDTFKVNNGGSISGNINGLNAIDTLDYSAYSSPVTVRLGTGNQVTATGIGGTVINIETLIGGATQNNNLIGANTVNNWNITDTNSGNIGSVNFRGFQNLTGGSNTDNFNLGTGGSVVNINGNAGNNTIIGANINNTWNITGNNTGNLNGANTYANIQTLTGGSETDTFKINNGGFFSGNINGLNGIDALDYSAYSSPVTVTLGTGNQVTATGIGGTVFNIETLIGGTTSNNTVIGANTANNWNITDTNSGNIGSVNFRGFQNLTGGTDTDNFTLSPEGSVVTIDGTAGNNTIIGANINNTWNITGNNTGNLNGANTYTNIQTVIGGSNVDTFKVNNGVNIAGIIDGSAGDDTIDYSANTSPATLTLANLVNIENAIGSAGSDTIIATNTANNWNITGTNSGDVNGFKFSDFENLTGGTDTDNFTLGNRGNVSSIDGNAGNNTIIGANKVNTWNITGNNAGNVNGANAYTNIQNLTGGNSNDTFKFNSGGYISGNIDGVNKKDTLDYSAYSSPVEVTLGINNQITATGVGGTILSIENLIGGTSGDNNLIGANTVNSWNITDTNSGNISDITFSGFQKLTGGSDTDNFIVSDRANITGTIIDGSAGNDTIDYSANTSAVTLTLENLVNVENGIGSAADNDTIIATNTANNWNITGTNSGDANGFNFSNFENVTGGNDSDTFTLSTDGSVAKIDGGGGNNTLVGANTVNNWNLKDTNSGDVNDGNSFTNIQNLTGGAETDTFKVKDGATIANNIDGNAGTDTLDYSTHSAKITVDMGARKATGVGGTISNIEGTVGGTNTENTLVATDTKNVWNLTSNNSGEVNGVTFSNFQNLTGGKLTDTFKFSDAVQISGIIDGGAGFDDLDYTAYTTPVTVDIPTGTATGTGGIKNIDPLPTSDFSADLQGETPPPVSVENQPDNTPVLCMDGSLEQQIPETQNLPRCQ